MDPIRVAFLGAIAGFTIFLGLPFARLRRLNARTRAFLSVVSAGILLFIFWDVVSATHDILEPSLTHAVASGAWGAFATRLVMAVLGLSVGALGLGVLDAKLIHRAPLPVAGAGVQVSDLDLAGPAALETEARRSALALGMMVAVAIGLHNFSEGLAIGVSAKAGEVALAGTLIMGFALHNATEGFAIVGPLGMVRPSWGWLVLAGVIGGGPTFVGTLVGFSVSSEPLEIAFFALAAGAILYVVGEIWGSAQRRLSTQLVLAGLVLGFLLGLLSDLVITAGGG